MTGFPIVTRGLKSQVRRFLDRSLELNPGRLDDGRLGVG
jgi:hypothetical protein